MTDKAAAPAANKNVKVTDVSLEGDDTFEEFASHGMYPIECICICSEGTHNSPVDLLFNNCTSVKHVMMEGPCTTPC
jgi:hypothetical protein